MNAPDPTAEVTITWSPQTIGDDHPRPGTSAFQETLIVVDHFVGSVATEEMARPDGPRNCGHAVSGAGAAGTNVARNKTTMAASALTPGLYDPSPA